MQTVVSSAWWEIHSSSSQAAYHHQPATAFGIVILDAPMLTECHRIARVLGDNRVSYNNVNVTAEGVTPAGARTS